MKTIGVWDSGVGGLSVLRALLSELPAERFVYVADSAYAPYGARSADSVTLRALAIAQALQDWEPLDALVVACNTATAGAIEALRQRFPALPVVGIEPALKPAAQATHTGHVGVLATQGTLHSPRFAALMGRVREAFSDVSFSCQPCEGLADAIEQGHEEQVRALCETAWSSLQDPSGKPIDQLVLGCTHYPFAAPALHNVCGPGVTLVDPAQAVARQTRRVLGLPAAPHRTAPDQASMRWFATGSPLTLARAARRWIDPLAVVEHLPA
ncbi:MAG: glutamate racemase [Burkholderiaceae bacterium]